MCVSLIDLVTTRKANLYHELLDGLDQPSARIKLDLGHTYAVTCRLNKESAPARLETWAYPLAVGNILPRLPLWLSPELGVTIDLEASYESACRALRIA